MVSKNFTVRIIKPSTQPAVPKLTSILKIKSVDLFDRVFDFAIGSGIGFIAGSVIFVMLKSVGLELSGLESTLIIALPSLLGLFTSLVIF